MNRVSSFLERVADRIRIASADIGHAGDINASALDRGDSVALESPGLWSPNRSCRLIEAKDGWIAANLPREDDLACIPALLAVEVEGDPWPALIAHARARACDEIVARAELLGLAICKVGETHAATAPCAIEASATRTRAQLRVLDFSSLWAGPLCGSVFAAMGAEVTKLESIERPDPTARATPLLDRRLNGAKAKAAFAIATPEGRAALLDQIAQCDVLITSARARALAPLGINREFKASLIWIAVTGHGIASDRVAFGDDAAAAGNLLGWQDGAPHFIGDAVADPLTGLAAAAAALELVARNQAGFIDAALARTAAFVASARA